MCAGLPSGVFSVVPGAAGEVGDVLATVCANRIPVQASIYDRYLAALTYAVEALVPGDGMDDRIPQGPLIDEAAVAKSEQHIADAVALGGWIMAGGGRHSLGGTWFVPTIITDARQQMLKARGETFGPIALVFRFRDEAEAARLANDAKSGPAAYFLTRDLGRAWRVAEALGLGIVGANTDATSHEGAPFGGLKASGSGREGSHPGIGECLEIKYLCATRIGAA